MDAVKVSIGLALSSFFVLFGLIIFIGNPEQEDYENTVESLMIRDGLSSVQEVWDSFPELVAIKSNMERIAFLKRNINALTGGPAPNVSTEEMLLIDAYQNEIVQLQKKVNDELTKLKAAHSVAAP